jgi:DNA repair photolyase
MGKNEKVALLILLLLLLLMFGYLSKQLEEQPSSDANPSWTTGPPTGGPSAATDGDIPYADIPPPKIWAMILQMLLEAALEQVQEQMENQQEQVQNQVQTEMNTQFDTNINSETQTQINITIAQVQEAVNVLTQINIEGAQATVQNQMTSQQEQIQNQVNVQIGEPTITTTTNTEIQTSLKALKEQLENQVNTQMSTGAQVDPVLNESIQTQLELIRQQVESSVQTSQPTVTTTTNTEIQTSIKALKEQLENQVNTQMSTGAQIDPVLNESIQTQLEMIRQQVESSVQTSQPTVTTTTNTEIQTSLKALQEQLENQVNAQASVGVSIDPVLNQSIQSQLELIRQQVESSVQTSQPTVTTTTNTEIQTSLKALQEQLENQVNAQASVGVSIDPVLNQSIQSQLELIRQQVESSVQTSQPTVTTTTNTEIQTSLKALQEQLENQVNAQASVGVSIDPVLNQSIQSQLELIRQQVESSVQTSQPTVTTTTNTEIQTSLKALQEQLENQVNSQASGGVSIDPVLNQSIQSQLELIRQQVESSVQTSQPTVTTTTNTEIQSSLKALQEQLENQVNAQASVGVSIDPVLNQSIQSQLELIRQQVESSVQTGQPTVTTTTNTEIQTSLKALQEQLENQVNAQASGGVSIDPVLNQSIQSQLELIRQQVEASVQTSQPTITTTTNAQIQTSLKALKEQLENQVNAQASVGVTIDPVLNQSIQSQLELIRQQVEASVQTGQPTITTTTNTEIQTSLKALQEQLENQVNAQASVGVSIDPVLNQSIQSQLELIRQQVESSVQTSQPTVTTTTNTEIKTSLKALQEQLENQVNSQASGGVSIDPVLNQSIQSQLELIRQQVEASVQTGQPTITTTTNAQIQTSLKALKEQLENQVNAQASVGVTIDPVLNQSIQNQLELIRQQIDDSLRVGRTTDLTIPNAEVQAKLELEKNKIENSFNRIARRIFPIRRRYARLASAEINRIVEGNVEIKDPYSPNPEFERKFKQDFNKRGESGAFAYAPRQLSARTAEWGRKLKIYMLRIKKKVKKSQWYVNAKDPWNNIDLEKQTRNAKMFALEFVDFFDEICDKISIAAIFVDGFLYDPDGTGLDWYPLSEKALDQVAQQSVKIQLEEFKIYNASLGPDEVKSSYPLVSGPLDILDADVTNFAVSSRNDPEYAQRRMEYEVDAVRKKILEDTSKPYRKMIIDAGYNGDETELADYLAEDPLNSILDSDGLLSPKDFDDVYEYAFTEVCSYHGGKTYVDLYTDADGNKGRKRPQCGWATKEACVQNAETWINSQGQFGTYGEWFTWIQLNTIFTKLKESDPSFEAPLTTSSKLYPELSSKGMCIVTGAGQHFSCQDAGGIYNSETHRCVFNDTICQYYGTCYDPATGGCFMPTKIEHAQNFLGQSFPREWIRLHGCFDNDSNDTENFKKVMRDIGNFFTKSGLRMLDDMVKNKKNWKEGAKVAFSDPDTIANLSMIVLPRMLSLGTGPSMIAIAFVVGGMMADAALSVNRIAAQMPPAVPAEYTVGGWRSNHTDIPFKDRCKVTGITVTLVSTQQGPLGVSISTVYLVFTTDTSHGFAVGDKLYHQGLSQKIGINFYDATGQNSEFTISEVPTPTTIKISQVYSVSTQPDQSIDPTGVYVYARTLPATKTYDYTLQPTADKLKGLIGIPKVKIPISVGFVPGWVTKPLRPRRSDGTTLVSVTEGVDKIAGVVTQDFYIDLEPRTWSILPNGCSTTQYSENAITTSCVNKQYTENYRIAERIDGNGLDAAQLYRCLAKGLTGWVWAFSDICKKATAVDAATGFIQNAGASLPVAQGFEWQSLQKYKRLCSERDTYEVGPPMVRAWDAPHINTTWCIPETPPASWADDNIGKLNTTESIYARNRVWTGAEDESSPSVHTIISEEGGNERVGDSAKYWYYQLVYDPELFNRNSLWDDKLLSDNFSAYTISEMRRYYCLRDFTTYYEADPPTLELMDDKCWGYMSIFTKDYSYTPMTNVGNIS